MWSLDSPALAHWNGGKIVPKSILYRYDGPTVFTADIGLIEFLFYKIDEDTNSELFLIAPTTDKVVEALKGKSLSVRGALASSSDFWIVDITPDWNVRKTWKVSLSDLDADFLPHEGIGVAPLKSPAADFVEQALSFFSTRFTGEDLSESRIPFLRFKTLIDSAYDSIRKIFPPPIVDKRSIGRSLEFGLLQPKFSSLIVAIDRPVIDERDLRKYITNMPNDWTIFARGFEKNRQDFFDRIGELVKEADKGEIKKAYAVEHFDTLDQVNEIVPTDKNELDRVEFRSQQPSLSPVAIDDRLGTKFRLAHRLAELAPRQITGSIIDINEASATMVILDSSARQVTCVFDRADYESLDVAIGDRIRVHGNFTRRSRRDKVVVTAPPSVVN